MAGGIKVSIDFKPLLEKIQEAGGSIDDAAKSAVDKGAAIVEDALRNECAASGVPTSVTSEIQTTTEGNGNRYSCKVGWKMGNYDPQKPSAGYKAVFLNYGTPRRSTKSGANRGKIDARGFIGRAKKKAKPKVKKAQEEALQEILKGLKE